MTEPFNEWQAAAAGAFRQSLGFDDGEPGGEIRAVNVRVGDNDHVLNLERDGEALVLAVFREAPPAGLDEIALHLLEKCGYHHYHPFLVQVGMNRDASLVLTVRLNRAMADRLLAAYEFIRQLYREAGL